MDPALPGKGTRFVALLTLFSVTTGCANVEKSRTISGVEITPNAAEQIIVGSTTREQIAALFEYRGLNPPRWRWDEERALAFTWETEGGLGFGTNMPVEQRRRLPSIGQAVNTPWTGRETHRAFCVIFDKAGRVVRHAFFQDSDADKLKAAIEVWIRGNTSARAPKESREPTPISATPRATERASK